jgi:hypothetical protein
MLPPSSIFALTESLASGAETAELHGRHELVGSLFGYPDCCVASFVRQQAVGADYTSAGVPSLGPFPRVANPVVPYVYGAINTLFHFPCQVDCPKIFGSEERTLGMVAGNAARDVRLQSARQRAGVGTLKSDVIACPDFHKDLHKMYDL